MKTAYIHIQPGKISATLEANFQKSKLENIGNDIAKIISGLMEKGWNIKLDNEAVPDRRPLVLEYDDGTVKMMYHTGSDTLDMVASIVRSYMPEQANSCRVLSGERMQIREIIYR